jgi:hypothetical protein
MSALNVPATLAKLVRASGANLYKAASKMPEDRLVWHPTPETTPGRDALDQVAECAILNGWAAGILASKTPSAPDWDAYKAALATLKESGSVLSAFKENTEALAAAAEALPEGEYGDTIPHPVYDNTQITWAEFVMFFYWNNVYHEGQINYIQVLYGDLD